MKIIISGHSRRGRQSGQSLVELAISLTVILLLLAGAVDFGMAFYSYVALQDAAQEGALYASINPCTDGNPVNCVSDAQINIGGIRDRVRASSRVPLDFSNTSLFPDTSITATLEPSDGRPCEGPAPDGTPNAIRVTIAFNYRLVMPFAGTVLGQGTIPLRASVLDTILEPRCQ